MKKILILLFLTPLAYADMDFVCGIDINESSDLYEGILKQIKEKDCVRNNILHVDFSGPFKGIALEEISEISNLLSSIWCRFDRNTTITYDTNNIVSGLSCVLYSSSPRQIK
tara:strand:- start:521 stop:856 length:336 start_codon:yes stop_codon:yes gene_type:complete